MHNFFFTTRGLQAPIIPVSLPCLMHKNSYSTCIRLKAKALYGALESGRSGAMNSFRPLNPHQCWTYRIPSGTVWLKSKRISSIWHSNVFKYQCDWKNYI